VLERPVGDASNASSKFLKHNDDHSNGPSVLERPVGGALDASSKFLKHKDDHSNGPKC
jgi:hypothetical protein